MDLDIKQLSLAVKTIAEEKNLPEDSVKEIVEQALSAAYRKDFGSRDQEVKANMSLDSGDVEFVVSKQVVDKVDDESIQISLSDAKKTKKDAKLDDDIEILDKPKSFGRVAAQTAKQVVLQRLREAEREVVMSEFKDKIDTVVNGIVSRVEGRMVRFELGRAQAIMPMSEQIKNEHYHAGQRLKVLIKDIERGPRGPQLIVSRASTEFMRWLFKSEVPEMESGAVEIRAIAREAGVRSKIAVASTVPGVDPVGTFVGGHGTRVNAVMSEIGDQEKIDIVVWDEDSKAFIINSLSPTEVEKVQLDDKEKTATVTVKEDQQSIAIGRGGQNVRLASKLTGYEIDIVSEQGKKIAEAEPPKDEQPKPKDDKAATDKKDTKETKKGPKRKSELESSLLEAINKHGDSTQKDSK